MKHENIIQDYYGATFFIDENKDSQLIIFIVDDNKVYLNLLERTLKRPNFAVYTFKTGEECIEWMRLKPDLVLLDYHLDGVNPYAKNGDVIYALLKEISPETEIIMISTDNKFKLISNLHLSQTKNILYKDKFHFKKIIAKIDSVLVTRQNYMFWNRIGIIKKSAITLLILLALYSLIK